MSGLRGSTLLKSMSWLTAVSGLERVFGLVQTVLLARALGITEYGVYGLIFGTIGLVASLAALQMGLTATVFVARYKEKEKEKAAYVLQFVNRFGLTLSALFLVATIPFAGPIRDWLIGPDAPASAVIAGCLMVTASLMSGMQDGILEGFEDFRSVAIIRAAASVLTVAAMYPAAYAFGLIGAMVVVLSGIALKYLFLSRRVAWHVKAQDLPARGSGLSAKELILNFGLPSMLVSLLTGVIGWIGSLILSRQAGGFDSLAVVNTGLQWRGPLLLIAGIVGSVAIPAISRHLNAADHAAIRLLKRQMLLYVGGLSLVVAVAVAASGPLLLRIYGRGFTGGTLVFAVLVLSTVPQVVVNIYCQHFLARAQVWKMLALHLWLVIPMAVSYWLLIPAYHSLGFAISNLVSWSIFAAALALQGEAQPSAVLGNAGAVPAPPSEGVA